MKDFLKTSSAFDLIEIISLKIFYAVATVQPAPRCAQGQQLVQSGRRHNTPAPLQSLLHKFRV